MLKITVIELLLRAIPEWVLLIIMAYVISDKKFDKCKIVFSSFIMAPINYFVRMLPVHFGVHIIIGLLIYLLLCTFVNEIDIMKSISSVLISTILLLICEGINIGILQYLFGINAEKAFIDPIMKTLYGIPSLTIFGIFIFIIYAKNNKKRKEIDSVLN